MRLHFPEDPASQEKEQRRHGPEIQAVEQVAVRPCPAVDRFPVALYDIGHRVDVKDPAEPLSPGKLRRIEHDRHRPDPDLEPDGNDLTEVPEKDRDRRNDVPWDELIADDKESLGPRNWKSFVFPWK